MYSDSQKMFLLCKQDVQLVGTGRIDLPQGKKKGVKGFCLWHHKIYMNPWGKFCSLFSHLGGAHSGFYVVWND